MKQNRSELRSSDAGAPPQETDVCVELCANIDDQPAETLAFALGRALEAGALDAWFTPIQMKKNRPAVLFTVLTRKEDEARMAALILRETSTLGVRVKECRRYLAGRAIVSRETRFGTVRFKRKILNGEVVSERPEYDDLERIARETGMPVGGILNELAGRAIPANKPET